MGKNYYCLVASLREETLDGDHKGFNAAEIIADIGEQLSGADLAALRMFYTYYDIENIINLKAGRSQFSALGNFGRESLIDEIEKPEQLPIFLRDILHAYSDVENADYDEVDTTRELERSLFEAYYRKCAASGCKFIRQWNEFDCNLRNVCAAYTARRNDIPVGDVVVGDSHIAQMLSKSSAADFSLKGELEYIDIVMSAVADESNLIEKEHKIDQIRWSMSDSLTEFDYFDINTILAYLVKINIVHRWVSLDQTRGRAMLKTLLESLDGKRLINRAEQENQ